MKRISFKKALELAKAGQLEPDAPEWALAYKGKILAEQAIEAGFLPEGFNGWHWLIDKYDCTMAHLIVSYNRLPLNFTQWHLACKCGYTVAVQIPLMPLGVEHGLGERLRLGLVRSNSFDAIRR